MSKLQCHASWSCLLRHGVQNNPLILLTFVASNAHFTIVPTFRMRTQNTTFTDGSKHT
ncbi:hypothetical protein T4B_6615 [Trichinella pseudospiralis]|uniref:Uncharacterized protein n=1 Tax=Trichinella pseudospiralis TaxID=6337 RepID=A0A0V1GLL4_TRIPS|nr:hypothetical protein T4B_6615 [Trichinella pseudospiralis]